MNEILSLFFPFSGVKNKSPPKIGATLPISLFSCPKIGAMLPISSFLSKLQNWCRPYKISAAIHIYLFSKKIKYRQNHFYFLVASSENLYGSIGFFSC
jgi:hypothetical protein